MAAQHLTTLGARFNFLTVVGEPFLKDGGNRWHVHCRCDCGATKDVMCRNVVNGHTMSCGCYKRNMKRSGNRKHGMSGTSTWRIYHGMLTRCHNQNSSSYPRYGGRGIYVCDRWRGGFEAFLEDMGERPYGKTLDRIDNDGPYSPGNCRWATDEEQRSNKSTNCYLEFNGERKTAAEWSAATGIERSAIAVRIKLGWPVERILTEPTKLGKNQFGDGEIVEFSGRRMTWQEWAKELGISYYTLKKRMEIGWSLERTLTEPLHAKRK